jgi:hypothetical protein
MGAAMKTDDVAAMAMPKAIGTAKLATAALHVAYPPGWRLAASLESL